MISLVAQERLLGFALGSGLVGAAVLEQRRAIHRSMTPRALPLVASRIMSLSLGPLHILIDALISAREFAGMRWDQSRGCQHHRRPLYNIIASLSGNFGQDSGSVAGAPRRPDDIEMAHIWNRAVDRALAPLIAALSSRGW